MISPVKKDYSMAKLITPTKGSEDTQMASFKFDSRSRFART